MSSTFETETIAALATPVGQGGIAVVRLSGPKAPEILKGMFRRSSQGSDWQSHRLYYGKVVKSEGDLLDQGLAVWMKAPRSFTGEEVVEIHLHGGPLIARKVLEAVFERGARPAAPGEFSERAFVNGKMDLTQAEAVADLIAAQSEKALKLAQAQWQGALSGPVSQLRRGLLDLLVNLEAAIDFPEEEIEIVDRSTVHRLLEEALRQIRSWCADYELGRMIREGIHVVLVGKPNVGKSSLLNQLTREEAAIVHHQPGTTRDIIDRVIYLEGIAVHLIDTAGIREASGEVEKMGIERSRRWIEKADLVLALFDHSTPLSGEDFEIADLASKKRCLFVLNKADLPPAWDIVSLPFARGGSGWGRTLLHCPNDVLPPPTPLLAKEGVKREALRLSAKTGEGLRELEKRIPQLFGIDELEKGDHLLLNQLRHKEALEKGGTALGSALEALEKGMSSEFIAADVRAAADCLGEIIGEVTTEHILEDIFSRFCIGK